jgi:hypothetical protein
VARIYELWFGLAFCASERFEEPSTIDHRRTLDVPPFFPKSRHIRKAIVVIPSFLSHALSSRPKHNSNDEVSSRLLTVY